MEQIINNFKTKYPRTAEYAENITEKYSTQVKNKMVINAGIVVALINKGAYNKYLVDGAKIDDEIVDMFSMNYLRNYCRLLDKVYEATGIYETLNLLDPTTFVEKAIKQYA
jgi:hypothetical protein